MSVKRSDKGDNRARGLYGKYRAERVDGQPIDRCIVLELKDPNTWDALLVWADAVEADGYVGLAHDVRGEVLLRRARHMADGDPSKARSASWRSGLAQFMLGGRRGL